LPIAMFIGITATANHFILDAVGGAIVIGMAFGLTALIWKYKDKLHLQKKEAMLPAIVLDPPKENRADDQHCLLEDQSKASRRAKSGL
jgi:hypothetical protein